MDLQAALLAGIAAEAAVIGAMWIAFNSKVKHAEELCAEDRKVLRSLVQRITRLDGRSDWTETYPGELGAR